MDACRNNPFERSWRRSANGNGLAMMNAPTGTLIAYATAPGRVASDGETANGLYTSMLLKFMKDPNLTLEQVFKKVRTEVTEMSSGEHGPWETTSLTGADFFLSTKTTVTQPERNPVGSSTTALPSTGEDHELSLQFYNVAQDLYDKYDYKGAVENYSKAIQYNPLDFQAYLWRGHSKYNLGYDREVKEPKMLEAAIEDYSKAIQLNPYEAEAYYYRANAKKLLKRYAEAIPDFTLSLRYDPNKADAYYYRGLTYYLLKQYAAGKEDFSKMIELQPTNSSAYYWRGGCYYGLTKYEESLLDFDKSLELDPTRTDAVLFKADAHYGMGDYNNSIKYYNQVISKQPNSIDAIMYLAHSYFNLGEYQTALDEYQRCARIDPRYSDAFYWRSRVYKFGLKDDAKAKAEIKKALAIEPSDPTYTSYYEQNFK
jgi:tetratricopeptide (TPR) repeat protein